MAWGLALVGAGWARRAGVGWARICLSIYDLQCARLPHVFMMSLCLSSCVSQMCIMGLEQNKAWHWSRKRGFGQFRVCKVCCEDSLPPKAFQNALSVAKRAKKNKVVASVI